MRSTAGAAERVIDPVRSAPAPQRAEDSLQRLIRVAICGTVAPSMAPVGLDHEFAWLLAARRGARAASSRRRS